MPTPQLRVRSRSACATDADPADQVEDRLRGPGAAVEGGRQLVRQHPLEVGGQPAAGDVRHRVGRGAAGQVEAGLGVDPGRLEQLLAERAAELVDVPVERPAGPGLGEQHVAHQRVAVGVQPARAPSRSTTSPARTRPGPSRSAASTTPVVEPATSYSSGPSRPGVLGGLAADQRAAGLRRTPRRCPGRSRRSARGRPGRWRCSRSGTAARRRTRRGRRRACRPGRSRSCRGCPSPARSRPWCRRRRRRWPAAGGRSALSALASKSPAKPPMPPIISGRRAFSTQTFISSTALSPASMETPAASYVAPAWRLLLGHRGSCRAGGQGRSRASPAPPPDSEADRPSTSVGSSGRTPAGACRGARGRAARSGRPRRSRPGTGSSSAPSVASTSCSREM